MDKTLMIKRFDVIAKRLNIEYIAVKRIIDAYVGYCKDELENGRRVTFAGIVSIVPNKEVPCYKTTTAYICWVIAVNNGFTYITVNRVMSEFFKDFRNDILNGEVATMRGLVTVYPLRRDGVVSVLHANISRTLQGHLREIGRPARVHTSKMLKYRLKALNMKVDT